MAGSKKVAAAGGKDRFEDLPEHVLELLLLFLDARDVVRTSVLARRWRDLWKSVPVLRFRPSSKFGCAENFNNFVNMVLECRDQTSPLRECHVHSYLDGEEDETHRDVESWVQYAVSCQVSVLRVLMWGDHHCNLGLSNDSVISEHLTKLELYGVDFEESPLDLLSCQALEVLHIDGCCLNPGGLVTFELQHCEEWTPILESMPLLATSSIIIGFECKDNCDNFKYLGNCGVEPCEG
ncbi:unnamed protein product [Triticum turgidum subsp. durum]|nr:unnamed protein product [Triticum turgidum subsp. durum]